jgi:hypothetical protein
MPERLVVLSDMQFDCADRGFFQGTNYEYLVKMYQKYDYKVPQIIFWNLRAGTVDFPVPGPHMKNICLVAGFSPSVLKALIQSPTMSPYTIVRHTIDDSRYDAIKYY